MQAVAGDVHDGQLEHAVHDELQRGGSTDAGAGAADVDDTGGIDIAG